MTEAEQAQLDLAAGCIIKLIHGYHMLPASSFEKLSQVILCTLEAAGINVGPKQERLAGDKLAVMLTSPPEMQAAFAAAILRREFSE